MIFKLAKEFGELHFIYLYHHDNSDSNLIFIYELTNSHQ